MDGVVFGLHDLIRPPLSQFRLTLPMTLTLTFSMVGVADFSKDLCDHAWHNAKDRIVIRPQGVWDPEALQTDNEFYIEERWACTVESCEIFGVGAPVPVLFHFLVEWRMHWAVERGGGSLTSARSRRSPFAMHISQDAEKGGGANPGAEGRAGWMMICVVGNIRCWSHASYHS